MSDQKEPWYARFIRDHGCIRSDGSVRPEAFLDKRPPHNTSVNRHECFKDDIHWDEGATIDPKRPMIGAADISASEIHAVHMSVEETHNQGEPPHHAEIRGWNMDDSDEGKHARKEVARELASRSEFVEIPSARVKSTCGDSAKLDNLLTIVIPVKNEEKNLPACLENVREFGHVVLVDSESNDKTREIFEAVALRTARSAVPAGGRGWEIVDFKWDGKFPKKRNWVLRNYKFKTPWVLFLDADERVTEAWRREAEALLSSPDAERYDVIKCYYDNWFMGKMLRHGDCMQKTAMVRVGAAEYEKIDEDHWSSLDMEIHEHLQPQRKDAEGEIRAHMEHHDKRSFESHVAKHREYAKWEANRYRQLMSHPERWNALSPRQKVKYRNLTKWWLAPAYFAVCYIRKLGFLDGYAGLRFALFKAWYFSLVRRTIGKLR